MSNKTEEETVGLQQDSTTCEKTDTQSTAKKDTSETNVTEQFKEIPMPSGPKTRYEWYQTETHVVVSILVKNVKKEDLKCDIHDSQLSCSIRLPSGSDYSLELDLFRDVDPDQSTVKILSTRVEIKLKKKDGYRWDKLESDGERTKTVKQFSTGSTSVNAAETVHKYPSSSHYHHNWDKLEAEIKAEEKDEKLDGDAAINKLFQQIYADGSDETRRAMNKSFMESGGTVLSTNWKEIAKQTTEVKPPDGMEYKKWEC